MDAYFIEPNTPAPNLRTGRGGIVHLGIWADPPWWSTERCQLIAACHESTRSVPPGPWTNDLVTCKNCLIRLRRTPELRKPELTLPVQLVGRRAALFYEAIDYYHGYTNDIVEVRRSKEPADREITDRLSQLFSEMYGLAPQCTTDDDFKIARFYIADARSTVADLLLRRFLQPPSAA